MLVAIGGFLFFGFIIEGVFAFSSLSLEEQEKIIKLFPKIFKICFKLALLFFLFMNVSNITNILIYFINEIFHINL